MFMDKLYKNLAYRKDFQVKKIFHSKSNRLKVCLFKLTNTSISPLMVNWANMIGEQIINVEPVVAEIRK